MNKAVKDIGIVRHTADSSISLFEYVQRLQRTVRDEYAREEWVRVEIVPKASASSTSKAVYLELIDKDENGNISAKLTGVVWRNQWTQLSEKFSQETGQALGLPGKYLLKLRLNFHGQYGVSAFVSDVDSSFTLGDIALRRREIKGKLEADGIVSRNKDKSLPDLVRRVAVICPLDSAAEGDFRNRGADPLQDAGAVEFKYFQCRFVATKVHEELRSVFESAQIEPFDLLVIMRGGGDSAGLLELDTLDVCRGICHMPMPVVTALGHNRDNDILIDSLSACSVDTPSKAIEFIKERLARELGAVESAIAFLNARFSQRIDGEFEAIKQARISFSMSSERRVHEFQNDVSGFRDRFVNSVTERWPRATQRLENDWSSFNSRIISRLSEEGAALRDRRTDYRARLFDYLERDLTAFNNGLLAMRTGILARAVREAADLKNLITEVSERVHSRSLVELNRIDSLQSGWDWSRRNRSRQELRSVEAISDNLERKLSYRIDDEQRTVESKAIDWIRGVSKAIDSEKESLNQLETKFDLSSPLSLTTRGFALVKSETDRVVKSAVEARQLNRFTLKFADGTLTVVVAT